jgi:hypothetical protein
METIIFKKTENQVDFLTVPLEYKISVITSTMVVLYKICSKPLEKGPRNTETEIDLHNNLSSLEDVLFSKNICCKD